MTDFEAFLAEWASPGPMRSVKTTYERLVNVPGDLNQLISEGASPLFMSVNPIGTNNEVCAIDRLFFHFGYKGEIPQAWSDTQAFNESLRKHYGAGAITVFNSYNGYTVYVWLKEPVAGSEKDLVSLYNELQLMLIKGAHYPTLNRSSLGNIRAMTMVPYTVHPITLKMVTPVTLEREPLELEHGFSGAQRASGLGLNVVDAASRRLENPELASHGKHLMFSRVRPCINAVLKGENPQGVSLFMMRAAVAELTAKGHDPDGIMAMLRGVKDLDEREAWYMLELMALEGRRPFKCATIMKKDECLESRCRIWRKREKRRGS